jgi:prolyl oligopeptidase
VIGLLLILMAAPPTAKSAVTDAYHGVAVVDEYRWLENGADAKVRAWTAEQNRATRSRILRGASVSYSSLVERPNGLFALKSDPARQQPMVVLLRGPDDLKGERVVVDPNGLDAGGHTAIDWFVPSPDGRLVAVSLSAGGSESGDVHLFDVAAGRALGEVIPRVNGGTAGGSLAWAPDGKGFYYTRYPRGQERKPEDLAFYQQLYFHVLGRPTAEDRYEMGRAFPRIAEIAVEAHRDGRVLLTMQNGDSGEFEHYLREPETGAWRQITRYADRVVQAVFGTRSAIYFISRKAAPRGKILRFDGRVAKVVVGEDPVVALESSFGGDAPLVVTADAIYAIYQLGGPSEVRMFTLQGVPAGQRKAAPLAAVRAVVPYGTGVLFNASSYLEPSAWHVFAGRVSRLTAMRGEKIVDFSDCEAVREFAVSKDGTKVPLNVIRRKGTKRDGTNPVLLTGYGGFGISLGPVYSPAIRPLLDAGFVYVVANLRGGGEFGEQWHEQGRMRRKQNVFDDFLAVARHLGERKYTNASRLAIRGGSNGGLLMGAALTQAPGLFRAVVAQVGIYDMLRNELTPNGLFNTVEYGTVKEQADFAALHAYSPYHRVADKTVYPAVLLMTGENDPRVDPMHSRKMAARLQGATWESGRPVLLRTDAATGHGMGSPVSARIEETVDIYSFLFRELGVR